MSVEDAYNLIAGGAKARIEHIIKSDKKAAGVTGLFYDIIRKFYYAKALFPDDIYFLAQDLKDMLGDKVPLSLDGVWSSKDAITPEIIEKLSQSAGLDKRIVYLILDTGYEDKDIERIEATYNELKRKDEEVAKAADIFTLYNIISKLF
jgi:hypothetical protein